MHRSLCAIIIEPRFKVALQIRGLLTVIISIARVNDIEVTVYYL